MAWQCAIDNWIVYLSSTVSPFCHCVRVPPSTDCGTGRGWEFHIPYRIQRHRQKNGLQVCSCTKLYRFFSCWNSFWANFWAQESKFISWESKWTSASSWLNDSLIYDSESDAVAGCPGELHLWQVGSRVPRRLLRALEGEKIRRLQTLRLRLFVAPHHFLKGRVKFVLFKTFMIHGARVTYQQCIFPFESDWETWVLVPQLTVKNGSFT